jgi:hypothetical protein
VKDWTPEQRQLVCPTTAGRIMRHGHFVESVWQPLLAKAGLPYRKYHATRHSYATWMLDEGADVRWGPGPARPRDDRADRGHLHASGRGEARGRRGGAQSLPYAVDGQGGRSAEAAVPCRVARGARGTFLTRRRHSLHNAVAYLRVTPHRLRVESLTLHHHLTLNDSQQLRVEPGLRRRGRIWTRRAPAGASRSRRDSPVPRAGPTPDARRCRWSARSSRARVAVAPTGCQRHSRSQVA